MSLENKYFAELARRLRAAGITAGHPEKNRLTVLLNNQPVLSVSAGSDAFLLPAGSNNMEASELYHRVAQTADEVYAYGDIYGRLDDILGLTYRGGYHTQYTEDGGMEFRVWGLDVEIRNAPFASGDSAGDRFVADCEIELEVPVSFGGELLPPMRMTVKVSAGYTPRF